MEHLVFLGLVFAVAMVSYYAVQLLLQKFWPKQKSAIKESSVPGGDWLPNTMAGFVTTMKKEDLSSEQIMTVSVLLAGTVLTSVKMTEATIQCPRTGNIIEVKIKKAD